ncbi:MAG TPA: hypothetical protein VFV49_17830 [Thermoanaerobaculia bacterium]|nr:hypothetical protein [Thermoanaerobaculia bacterium]
MSSVESEKVVRITMKDGLPVPDQDPVVVKKDNQKVRWAADFDFRITVDGYSDVRHTNGGGQYHAQTGAFGTIKQYKYTISAGGVDNDPVLDIQP